MHCVECCVSNSAARSLFTQFSIKQLYLNRTKNVSIREIHRFQDLQFYFIFCISELDFFRSFSFDSWFCTIEFDSVFRKYIRFSRLSANTQKRICFFFLYKIKANEMKKKKTSSALNAEHWNCWNCEEDGFISSTNCWMAETLPSKIKLNVKCELFVFI